MNPAGITHSFHEAPLLPLASAAFVEYPVGGIETQAVEGAVVMVQIIRQRDPDTDQPKGQYMNVPLCMQHSTLSVLCKELLKHVPMRVYLRRKPSETYRMACAILTTLTLASVPEKWDDVTLINLANEMLAKVPVVIDGRATALLERAPLVRRAFAGCLTGLYKEQYASVRMLQPRTPFAGGPWHETLDKLEDTGYSEKVTRGFKPPFEGGQT